MWLFTGTNKRREIQCIIFKVTDAKKGNKAESLQKEAGSKKIIMRTIIRFVKGL